MPPLLKTPPPVYEMHQLLGDTLTSQVYLAVRSLPHLKARQKVVVKIFKKPLPDQLPDLQIQSLLQAKNSPHLTKILSFEYIKKRPALILEPIQGVSLHQLLSSFSLSQGEILSICQQSLMGLRELKKARLAHGDLSLSNIIIDFKGHVFLSDYGLSNYKSGKIFGTQPFVAPEIEDLQKSPDFLSDLFSLGVLYQILKGGLMSQANFLHHSHFIKPRHPLLDPGPLNRRVEGFFPPPPESPPPGLGHKVSEALDRKKWTRTKDLVPLPPPPPLQKKRRLNPLVLGSVFLGCWLFSTNPFVSYGKPGALAPGRLFLRTHHWLHARGEGWKGYAPLDVVNLPPGPYVIRWKNHQGRGVKHIELSPGQTLVLSDHDFP